MCIEVAKIYTKIQRSVKMVKWCHKKYLDRFSSFFCFEKKIIKYTSVSEFEDKQNNFKFNFFANFSALSNMALGAKKCTTNNLEDIIYVYCVIWFCIPPWRVLVIGPLGVFNLCSMYYEMSKLLHIFLFFWGCLNSPLI